MKMDLFKDNHPFSSFAHIDLAKARVSRNSPTIFVCGGLVDVTSTDIKSVRDLFFESISKLGHEEFHHYCIRAETFKDYKDDGRYKDLSEFENDLAHFASLLIIFLESAGAIVELGLFCNGEGLREKLLVFVNQRHYEQDSFIRHGPLESLKQDNDSSVFVYPWDMHNPGSMGDEIMDIIFGDILETISQLPKSEKFIIANPGHQAFLIFECIRLYRALRISEIQKLIAVHGIKLSDRRIKNLIYLLRISGLVGIKTFGKDTFYYSLRDEKKVSLSSKSRGQPFDFEGTRIAASVYYYENRSERIRQQTIESVYPKGEEENVTD